MFQVLLSIPDMGLITSRCNQLLLLLHNSLPYYYFYYHALELPYYITITITMPLVTTTLCFFQLIFEKLMLV